MTKGGHSFHESALWTSCLITPVPIRFPCISEKKTSPSGICFGNLIPNELPARFQAVPDQNKSLSLKKPQKNKIFSSHVHFVNFLYIGLLWWLSLLGTVSAFCVLYELSDAQSVPLHVLFLKVQYECFLWKPAPWAKTMIPKIQNMIIFGKYLHCARTPEGGYIKIAHLGWDNVKEKKTNFCKFNRRNEPGDFLFPRIN